MGNKRNIVIIDDDPQIHKMLATVLGPKDYELRSALNAHQGWGLIEQRLPDLIILDIMMPDITGIELCERIRESERARNCLILMLSAKDSQSDRITGLKYGADDYVTKPFHMASLVRKIEHMFEK